MPSPFISIAVIEKELSQPSLQRNGENSYLRLSEEHIETDNQVIERLPPPLNQNFASPNFSSSALALALLTRQDSEYILLSSSDFCDEPENENKALCVLSLTRSSSASAYSNLSEDDLESSLSPTCTTNPSPEFFIPPPHFAESLETLLNWRK